MYWQRRMILAGLLLILAGFVFGLCFSSSVGHEARLVAHDSYQPVFEAIADDGSQAEWRALERGITERSIAHRRAADTHGHSVNMGILLILVGLLAPLFAERAGAHRPLLLVLAVSAVVYPIGLSLQFFRLTTAGEIVSAAGAIGAIAALGALLIRFWKAVDTLESG
jgi:hypothetical protein